MGLGQGNETREDSADHQESGVGLLRAGHGGDLPEVVSGAVDHVVDDGLVEGQVVLVHVVVAVVHVDKD